MYVLVLRTGLNPPPHAAHTAAAVYATMTVLSPSLGIRHAKIRREKITIDWCQSLHKQHWFWWW